MTKPNPINDCAPFLVARSYLYSKKKEKEKKEQDLAIQPWSKNWQCGMKMKRWDQFKGK